MGRMVGKGKDYQSWVPADKVEWGLYTCCSGSLSSRPTARQDGEEQRHEGLVTQIFISLPCKESYGTFCGIV